MKKLEGSMKENINEEMSKNRGEIDENMDRIEAKQNMFI